MIDNDIIEEVKKRLIDTFNPVEIYIFGSYAWGSPDEESDLDLLIVVDHYEDKYKALVEGYKALESMPIPKDILIFNKAEFEQCAENKTKICYVVRKKGKLIYARA